jgi:hypothetical protein
MDLALQAQEYPKQPAAYYGCSTGNQAWVAWRRRTRKQSNKGVKKHSGSGGSHRLCALSWQALYLITVALSEAGYEAWRMPSFARSDQQKLPDRLNSSWSCLPAKAGIGLVARSV